MKFRFPLLLSTGLILAMSAIVVPSRHNPYTSRDTDRAFQVNSRLFGLYGDDLGEESFGALGGTPARASGGINTLTPISRGVYEITIGNTGTSWEETFVIGIPEAR